MVLTADREKLEVSVEKLKRRQVEKGEARVKKNGFNLIN